MAAEKLRDLTQPIDVPLLDATVAAFYGTGSKEQVDLENGILGSIVNRTAADQILRDLQNNPDTWLQVMHILQNTQSLNTKFFALQVLEGVIKYRWNALPAEQRDGMKNFISDVIVQILKHEWPVRWRSFIPDLVSAAKTSETICENCMAILKLLSEEVFDFSRGEMTQQKIKELKQSLNSEFQLIHELCLYVLSASQRTELICATLSTLHAFLSWIPLGYIFESPLLETLLKFFPIPAYQNLTLQCLTEVAALQFRNYFDAHIKMYNIFMVQLQSILPPTTNIPEAYAHGSSEEQVHIRILESTQENISALLLGLEYLINISYVDDTEVFKVCLDYWNVLVAELFEPHHGLENPAATAASMIGLQVPGMVDGIGSQLLQRRQLYTGPMSKLRMLMICRMAKPEEVLIVEDENGNIVRETMKDNAVLVQYKIMRETLIYLSHLDHDDTEKQMLRKLSKQLSGEDWTWNNLNTLCWAIGSISGSMMEEQAGFCSLEELAPAQTNTSVASSLGTYFLPQITLIFLDMLNVYRMYSELISKSIAEGGPFASRTSYVKLLRSVKRETLKLVDTFLDKAEDQPQIAKHFVPPMMDPVLGDYARNVPDARESEVLSLFATVVNKYKAAMVEDVPRIFEAVFQCTLEMITKNFEDYPEHRLKFFSLLRAIATHCFPALICLSSQQLKLVMDSIIWAFRHTERNIAETGLNLLFEMLKKFQVSEFCNQFYRTYFLTIEQEIFAVLTDTFHKPGFKLHVLVLQHLFCLADSGSLTEPLWDAATNPYPYPSNAAFVREFTIKLLSTSFPNMTASEVTQFVNGLFESTNDLAIFKTHIRDFLVQSKEFSAQDNKDLYAEEAAAQRHRERQRMLSIPGLVAPSELQDEMVDSYILLSKILFPAFPNASCWEWFLVSEVWLVGDTALFGYSHTSTGMGQAFRKLFDTFFGNTDMRIGMFDSLLVTVAKCLYGFNVEKVQYKNVIFTVWDVGGQEKLRPLWRHYFNNTDGLIYVVDSLDRERIGRAKQEFQTIINDPFMLNSVILVFANKQDLRGAMTPMEVCEGLGLFDLKNRKWHIQGTCALKGDGLYEGLDWLASTLKERKAAGFSSIGASSF
ncbi:Protein EXPORTIN [Vigna angularis]|uniref:Protein EXPORTIN n=2 Tax=Phaseolus angularis TaxID=3914 RepID=A0A8T0JIW2_PHAAN|nr:Protein EXPORTIN [Vigna angularis]